MGVFSNRKAKIWVLFLVALLGLSACATEVVELEVLEEFDVDPTFVQGLEIVDDRMMVSVGKYGNSSIGFIGKDGKYEKIDELEDMYFAEGMSASDKYIYQLTWRENMLFVRDRTTLDVVKSIKYDGEGWGLAFDGEFLIRSDGSNKLFYHDLESFEVKKVVETKHQMLNELEFVDGKLYANIWQSSEIVKLDPKTGETIEVFDLSELTQKHKGTPDDVLNGIAHIEGNEFYIGGKNWDKIYKVRLR